VERYFWECFTGIVGTLAVAVSVAVFVVSVAVLLLGLREVFVITSKNKRTD